MKARKFSKKEKEEIFKIKEELSWQKIDNCLKDLKEKKTIEELVQETGLSTKIIEGIIKITQKAKHKILIIDNYIEDSCISMCNGVGRTNSFVDKGYFSSFNIRNNSNILLL